MNQVTDLGNQFNKNRALKLAMGYYYWINLDNPIDEAIYCWAIRLQI